LERFVKEHTIELATSSVVQNVAEPGFAKAKRFDRDESPQF
jgi:hypothetical protein